MVEPAAIVDEEAQGPGHCTWRSRGPPSASLNRPRSPPARALRRAFGGAATATTSWWWGAGTTPSSPPPTWAGPACPCACSNGRTTWAAPRSAGGSSPGVDARLSRYSYLVSLLPDRIVADLGLRLEPRIAPVASFTPVRRDAATWACSSSADAGPAPPSRSARSPGSDHEYAAWRDFYADAAPLAEVVAPTLLEPLPAADELRRRVGEARWERLVARPSGETIEDELRDDTVRGVVLTDALIGTFASAHDPALRQNRCFLYHLIGNGTGEWRVPVGGMGAVTAELERAARPPAPT